VIIFDLDGTLADCEHRRRFVDVHKHADYEISHIDGSLPQWKHKETQEKWKPDWKAFYEACGEDTLITPTLKILEVLLADGKTVQIWSGRCESVRTETENWLDSLCDIWRFPCVIDLEAPDYKGFLKMRPIGDNTPDDRLKERWLDELIQNSIGEFMLKEKENHLGIDQIDFVFDSDPNSIRMWQRRGIFVFNCCQHDEEF
jgi:hypothetical protein